MRKFKLMASADALQAPPSALLDRVRGEFLEMPGLRLTPAQAARLWGVSDPIARGLLTTLAETRFLVHRDDGSYARWPN
ncbi:MAG: hypothetical protein ABI665_25575 [Vicinamibacterales bacterium]